jgi:hypothetical protein
MTILPVTRMSWGLDGALEDRAYMPGRSCSVGVLDEQCAMRMGKPLEKGCRHIYGGPGMCLTVEQSQTLFQTLPGHQKHTTLRF